MRIQTLTLGCCFLLAGVILRAAPARAQQKDYLSAAEADQIRDEVEPGLKIKLFLSFATDRIKKLQYELAHPANTVRRAERLNGLLNGYAGCMDDAVDLIEIGAEKQQDIRDGVKEMQARAPEFLTYLKDLAAKGPERNTFKDNLTDAIEATTDAIRNTEEAAKENSPPPVRRNPNAK